MDGYLRQSTASQTRTIGPFCDDTDFKTLKNALTIANTDVLIKKNGAASGAKNSGGATADGAGGLYHLTWDATDTATVGQLSYSVKVAGALVVFGAYTVLEEAVYDALFAASAPGYVANAPVSVAQWNGTNVATPDTAGYPKITVKSGTGTGEVSLSSGAVLLQATQTGVTIPTVTTLTNAPPDSSGVTTLLSRIPSTLFSGITSLAQWLGLLAGKQTGNSTARTELRATGAGSGTFDETTDSQEALRDKVDTLPVSGDLDSADDIATAVVDKSLTGHTTAGTVGGALSAAGSAGDPWTTSLPGAYGAGTAGKIIGDNLNATVSSRSSHTAADIWAVGTRTLTSFGTLAADVWAVGTRTLTGFGTLVADVWTNATRTLTSGANIVLAKGTGVTGLNDLDAAGVRSAVGLGSANLDAQLTAISSKTTNLPSDPADESDIIAATNALAAAIAALNNVSAADVLTQVNTALTTAVADSVPAVGARPSIAQAAYIGTQFNLRRGVSGTTMTLYKPDGSTLLTVTLNNATSPTAITRAT